MVPTLLLPPPPSHPDPSFFYHYTPYIPPLTHTPSCLSDIPFESCWEWELERVRESGCVEVRWEGACSPEEGRGDRKKRARGGQQVGEGVKRGKGWSTFERGEGEGEGGGREEVGRREASEREAEEGVELWMGSSKGVWAPPLPLPRKRPFTEGVEGYMLDLPSSLKETTHSGGQRWAGHQAGVGLIDEG
ncbi:hypothetical protein BDK51DRAFT_30538 [Blyttiomyces helicus]|uniref:Uncharacterized protein n=1 Tax=Blyttiomyces helicus TaxID=388810 RepID=A0A4P9W5T2_9FUNG|nr:hypothetical protein BDK51DRAFT_30538 [Blyttiomyces helicus]|eukprot:RKO85466.1 hypothetical protein BDK51DRAFT_30538 [Blyttiomyces helicus]